MGDTFTSTCWTHAESLNRQMDNGQAGYLKPEMSDLQPRQTPAQDSQNLAHDPQLP